MKTAYDAVTAQMEADIRDVFGFGIGDSVQFGWRCTAHNQVPNATVVLRALQRTNNVRITDEPLDFDILIELPRRGIKERDAEAFKVEQAEKLIQKLAPFVEHESEIGGTPARYAGVANRRQVTEFEALDDSNWKEGWSFRLRFSCLANVYQ